MTVPAMMAHQSQALQKAKAFDGFAYFMEMGTGKSRTVLEDFADAFRAGKVKDLLILAPKGSYINWAKQHIPQWLDVPHKVFVWRNYLKAAEVAEFVKVYDKRDEATILIMNVEPLGYESSDGLRVFKKFSVEKKPFCIVDESDCIKNPTAGRTRTLLKYKTYHKMRRILTGTPIPEGPMGFFSQMKYIDDRILPFKSYTAFKSYFSDMIRVGPPNRTFPKLLGYRNLDELTDMVKPRAFLVRKSECLDLPPKLRTRTYFEMDEVQKKAYYEMQEKQLTMLGEEQVSAVNGLAALTKLLQISAGHVITDSGERIDLTAARLEAFQTVIDQIPEHEPVCCWGTFTGDVDAMMSVLPGAVRFDGQVSMQEADDAVERFMNRKARFFVGTLAKGGRAHNFQHCRYMVYYTNSWKLLDREQSEDRIHRMGQTGTCHYIDIVAMDTKDEKVLEALLAKRDLASSVLDWVDFLR